MKRILVLLSLVTLFSSCNSKEEEEELDYDSMVMLDEEEEWSPNQETQEIAKEFDPQEFIIDDPELKTENASEELR